MLLLYGFFGEEEEKGESFVTVRTEKGGKDDIMILARCDKLHQYEKKYDNLQKDSKYSATFTTNEDSYNRNQTNISRETQSVLAMIGYTRENLGE